MLYPFDEYPLSKEEMALIKQLKKSGLTAVEVRNKILLQRLEQHRDSSNQAKHFTFGFNRMSAN